MSLSSLHSLSPQSPVLLFNRRRRSSGDGDQIWLSLQIWLSRRATAKRDQISTAEIANATESRISVSFISLRRGRVEIWRKRRGCRDGDQRLSLSPATDDLQKWWFLPFSLAFCRDMWLVFIFFLGSSAGVEAPLSVCSGRLRGWATGRGADEGGPWGWVLVSFLALCWFGILGLFCNYMFLCESLQI